MQMAVEGERKQLQYGGGGRTEGANENTTAPKSLGRGDGGEATLSISLNSYYSTHSHSFFLSPSPSFSRIHTFSRRNINPIIIVISTYILGGIILKKKCF